MVYSRKRRVIYAASRDRTIYAWIWPREKPEQEEDTSITPSVSDEYNVLVSEPTVTLQAHSLGVTALAQSEGMCVCECMGECSTCVNCFLNSYWCPMYFLCLPTHFFLFTLSSVVAC